MRANRPLNLHGMEGCSGAVVLAGHLLQAMRVGFYCWDVLMSRAGGSCAWHASQCVLGGEEMLLWCHDRGGAAVQPGGVAQHA